VQVDRSALELEFVDFALAVVLAAGLEGKEFGISRELARGTRSGEVVTQPGFWCP
jgi:hypothetical protein